MVGKIIRIIAATTASFITFVLMLNLGISIGVPYLKQIWGVPLVLALAYVMSANIKIWNEEETNITSLE